MSFNPHEFVRRHLECEPRDFKGNYTPDELHELCRKGIEILKNEPSLVRVTCPVFVVGDLFGSFRDLQRVFALRSLNGVNGAYLSNYMFLGNYVDHGKKSLETICLLLALKVMNHENYTLLRGNHEIAEVNRKEGFFDELVRKCGAEEAEKLFEHFNEVFSWLPFAGIIDSRRMGTFFCVHGGLSPHLRNLDDIEKIPRPLTDISTNPLANDLINAEFDSKATTGFRNNPNRPTSVVFGENNVYKFMEDHSIRRILRGDLHSAEGLEKHGIDLDLFVSLFTSSRFKGNSEGGFMQITDQLTRGWIIMFDEWDEDEEEEEEDEGNDGQGKDEAEKEDEEQEVEKNEGQCCFQ